MEKEIKLYRKRFIPEETVFLKDDKILYFDENIIVTKWNVLKPRKDFERGYSCYFLKKGFKISKFIDKEGKLFYYYCDIIETEYVKKENTFIFIDLLADVIVYENGFVKVVDIGEITDALNKHLIDIELAKNALKRLDELLTIIYAGDLKELIKNYFDE